MLSQFLKKSLAKSKYVFVSPLALRFPKGLVLVRKCQVKISDVCFLALPFLRMRTFYMLLLFTSGKHPIFEFKSTLFILGFYMLTCSNGKHLM